MDKPAVIAGDVPNNLDGLRFRAFKTASITSFAESHIGVLNRSRIILENHDFEVLGIDIEHRRASYILRITPKTQSSFMIRGRIWVDSKDFAIFHLEGGSAKNTSSWTRDIQVEH